MRLPEHVHEANVAGLEAKTRKRDAADAARKRALAPKRVDNCPTLQQLADAYSRALACGDTSAQYALLDAYTRLEDELNGR